MKRHLRSILRIRSLQESLAQQQFQSRIAEARELERAAAGRGELAMAVRRDAGAALLRNSPTTPAWHTGLLDAEILTIERQRLAAMAADRSAEAAMAQQVLIERSRDRRQAEVLVSSAMRAAERERNLREQKHLDDWFQHRGMRGTKSSH